MIIPYRHGIQLWSTENHSYYQPINYRYLYHITIWGIWGELPHNAAQLQLAALLGYISHPG